MEVLMEIDICRRRTEVKKKRKGKDKSVDGDLLSLFGWRRLNSVWRTTDAKSPHEDCVQTVHSVLYWNELLLNLSVLLAILYGSDS